MGGMGTGCGNGKHKRCRTGGFYMAALSVKRYSQKGLENNYKHQKGCRVTGGYFGGKGANMDIMIWIDLVFWLGYRAKRGKGGKR